MGDGSERIMIAAKCLCECVEIRIARRLSCGGTRNAVRFTQAARSHSTGTEGAHQSWLTQWRWCCAPSQLAGRRRLAAGALKMAHQMARRAEERRALRSSGAPL